MRLQPEQIGWSIISENSSGSIYKKLVILPKNSKEICLPDSIDRIYWPIETSWPNKEYHEVGIFHVLERVADIISFWKALYNVCANGAVIKVYGTYYTHEDAYADPTYLRGLSGKMFMYPSAAGRHKLFNDPYDDGVAAAKLTDVDFDLKAMTQISDPIWEGKSDFERDYFITHYNNVAKKVETVLVCYKPVRSFDGK